MRGVYCIQVYFNLPYTNCELELIIYNLEITL